MEWTRRRFLSRAVLAPAAAALAPAAAALVPRSLFARECELTTPDVLGPYWVQGAPFRTILASPDEAGTRLFIAGRVLSGNCSAPLEGTIVDVWHASDAGCYSVVEICPDEDPMNLRGQMLTSADGDYAFETVLPGYYAGRCRHIHLRIVPPEGDMLVTQLYFEGDPRIPDDPYASLPGAANRIIPLTEEEDGLHGEFIINLAAEAPADVEEEDLLPAMTALHPSYPNPFRGATTIRFQLHQSGPVELAIYTEAGRRVRTLVEGARTAGYHTVRWDGRSDSGQTVASGIYVTKLTAGPIVRMRKVLKIGD